MDKGQGEAGAGVAQESGSRSPEEIREDIAQTREEMGDTVQALAHKSDVKAQAQHKVDEVEQRVGAKRDEFTRRAHDATPDSAGQAAGQAKAVAQGNPVTFIAAGTFVAGLVIGRLSSRR